MIHVVHLIGSVAVWVALASSVAFCVTYAAVAPWWRSGEGTHLMTMTGVLAVAFAWVAYRQTVSTVPLRPLPTEIARVAILGALAAVLVWRLLLLIRAQIRRRR